MSDWSVELRCNKNKNIILHQKGQVVKMRFILQRTDYHLYASALSSSLNPLSSHCISSHGCHFNMTRNFEMRCLSVWSYAYTWTGKPPFLHYLYSYRRVHEIFGLYPNYSVIYLNVACPRQCTSICRAHFIHRKIKEEKWQVGEKCINK